nr:amino acid transporter [uncultured archaeon GZfos1D1]
MVSDPPLCPAVLAFCGSLSLIQCDKTYVYVGHTLLTAVSDTIWDPFMMVLLIGTGIFLTFRLRGIQARKLVYAFRLMLERKEEGSGDISPFRALMTTLSGTIGTGNIAGVATAISLGGPGAIF